MFSFNIKPVDLLLGTHNQSELIRESIDDKRT